MKTPEELQAEVDLLAANNLKLTKELKDFRKKATTEIDPDKFAAMESEVEELRSSLAKAEKTSKTEIEKRDKSLTEKDGALQRLLIDGGLTDAMVKAGVRPELMPAVKAMLSQKASIKADGEAYQAIMGDKPLSEAVTAWAASDEGKHFVSAPASSGGGAAGGGGKPSPQKGDLGGDKKSRVAALATRFPELSSKA